MAWVQNEPIIFRIWIVFANVSIFHGKMSSLDVPTMYQAFIPPSGHGAGQKNEPLAPRGRFSFVFFRFSFNKTETWDAQRTKSHTSVRRIPEFLSLSPQRAKFWKMLFSHSAMSENTQQLRAAIGPYYPNVFAIKFDSLFYQSSSFLHGWLSFIQIYFQYMFTL